TAGQALPRDSGRAGLGRPARERDEREQPSPCRAVAGLDQARRAIPRAHPGRRPGRFLPPRRLRGRDRARRPARGRPVSPKDLLEFLRRELAPTPGRASATLRLTLSALVVTVPVMTHHIQHALVAFVVMFLVNQEDVAFTALGAVLGVLGATLGLGLAL